MYQPAPSKASPAVRRAAAGTEVGHREVTIASRLGRRSAATPEVCDARPGANLRCIEVQARGVVGSGRAAALRRLRDRPVIRRRPLGEARPESAPQSLAW